MFFVRFTIRSLHALYFVATWMVIVVLLNVDCLLSPRGMRNIGDWRRDNVSRFVKQLSESIHAVKPWVKFGVYLDSKGDKSPYRMKMRPMGLTLTGALDPMLRGQKIADLITTGAAIDFVIPDIDR